MENEFLSGMLSSLKQEMKKSFINEGSKSLPELSNDLDSYLDSVSDENFSKKREGGSIQSQTRRRTSGRTEGSTHYSLDYSDIRDKLEQITDKTYTISHVESIVRLLRYEFGIGDNRDLEFINDKKNSKK